jgi:hypothetical protein
MDTITYMEPEYTEEEGMVIFACRILRMAPLNEVERRDLCEALVARDGKRLMRIHDAWCE